MKTMFGMLKVTLGVAVLATLFAQLAGAQCASVGAFKHTSLLRQPFLTNPFTPVAFSQAASGGAEDIPDLNGDPIVGFWRVNLISEGNLESAGIPDGTVLDAGFSQWHSDGTEILNSSRQPATQSFCLGVWEKVGPSTYMLNHFPLSWTPEGDFVGPANIREEVTLSPDHSSFHGTFTLDQYSTAGGVWPATPSQLSLAAHLTGNVQAKRITVNTTIDGVL
jgi:hypothetical protein